MTASFARLFRHAVAFAISTLCIATATAAPRCAPPNGRDNVVEVVEKLFAVLHTDDRQAFQEITTPDFYAYDGGMRFDGPALLDLIKDAQAHGKRFEWTVTSPMFT